MIYGVIKAIATATDRDLTIERLQRLHLLYHFDYLLCGNEVTKRKPHPEIYQKEIHHFGVDSKKALVLEDSVVGVKKQLIELIFLILWFLI